VQFDYLNVLVFAAVGFAFVFVNVFIGSLLRPKRKTEVGLEVYECGEETIGDSWINFDIRYYTVALIYVIFAVEITFLFPWAMVLTEALDTPDIGMWAVAKGVLFIVILFFGLIAVWSKGDLDWVLSYDGPEYVPTAERHRDPVPSLDELSPPEEDEDESHETETAAEAASA
jgi:NADH-quinone oxidoreductase subunit A